MSPDLEPLCRRIGYAFRDQSLLIRALTHSSWATEHPAGADSAPQHNQMLEFLGDAILGFLVSIALVQRFPHSSEGWLTKWRASLVRAERLYDVAVEIDLGSYLVLGKGEESSGGRGKKALLADAVEALIAALYLDGGMEAAQRFVDTFIMQRFDAGAGAGREPSDAKSSLQELAFARKLPPPRYAVVAEEGPGHARIFTVEVRIGKDLSARAEGPSKKSASQAAAQLLLDQLRASPNDSASRQG